MIMVNNLQPKNHNQKPKLAIIHLLLAVVCLLCSCSENDATEEEFPEEEFPGLAKHLYLCWAKQNFLAAVAFREPQAEREFPRFAESPQRG